MKNLVLKEHLQKVLRVYGKYFHHSQINFLKTYEKADLLFKKMMK